ncbi:hypothetical protein LG275_03720 [Chryseomicrobium palamuruense]
MSGKTYIDVPLGPANVEFGDTSPIDFSITKGGVVFTASSTKHDITVDQYGDTVVKSVFKGRTCQVRVPFALHDLPKLAKVTPNSTLYTDTTDPVNPKYRLNVGSKAGLNLTAAAEKLVIKPTDPEATPNDWITVPLASPMSDPEYTYNSDNERIAIVTFVGFPDLSNDGNLYIMGDETVTGV